MFNFRLVILIIVVVAANMPRTLAQEKPLAPDQVPSVTEPFNIGSGSSFSASGGGVNGRKQPSSIRTDTIERDIDEALSVIGNNHVWGSHLKNDQLNASAIVGLLRSLDPHSTFYRPEEFQALLGEYESEYTGTGCSIAGFVRNGQIEIYVLSTFPGSPAERGGVRFGDRILAVNGRLISGLSPDTVRDLIRGRIGTTVRITVERASDLTKEDLQIRRDRVQEPSVPKGAIIRSTIGYIDLTNGFGNSTYAEFDTALRDLKTRGITSLIIDLRGNRGGILSQAIRVAERFLPSGAVVVSQRGRNFADEKTWRANGPRPETMPLVVLVNERSASASEVVAGALQDNDRALVIGQKTFGKGLVQNVLHLPGGAGLTLTAARYFTPAGRSIQRDYETTSLYDYYQHRNNTAEIERSSYVARTLTNRVVYGGDGITPDEELSPEPMPRSRYDLVDLAFFFARDFLNGRVTTEADTLSSTGQIRQKMIFGEEIVDAGVEKAFAAYIAKQMDPVRPGKANVDDSRFAKKILAYYLAMGAFGKDGAERTRIAHDPAISFSANAMQRAADLANAAEAVRTNLRKQKRPSSLVLNGPR